MPLLTTGVGKFPAIGGGGGGNGNDANAALLLHTDGSNGGTSFPDSSAGAHTVTTVSGVTTDTGKAKFGTASAAFSASKNTYLGFGGESDLAFGSADFTIDMWVWFTTLSGLSIFYSHGPISTNGLYPVIYANGTTLNFFFNGSNQITQASAVVTGQWHHIAVARSSGSTKMFVDGTQVGSTLAGSDVFLNPASRPVIGVSGYDLANGLDGWIDELRVSNIARWTSNFTPPVAAYS